MEPKTKIQKIVAPIQAKIPSITLAQKKWAYKNLLGVYAMVSRNRMFCLECGGKWDPGKELIAQAEQPRKNGPPIFVKCPCCNKKLTLLHYNEIFVSHGAYWSVWQTYKDYQVLRISTITKRMQKNKKPQWGSIENMQYWITKEGQVLVFSAVYNAYSGNFEGSIQLRPSGKEKDEKYNVDLKDKYIYPVKKILPEIIRNGFEGEFHGLSPHELFSFLLTTEGETLFKTGHIETFKYFAKNQKSLNQNVWTALRICIRNKYKIKREKISDYIDYLKLLIFFGKDINNSFYVCPKNMDKEHNRLVAKKQIIDVVEMRAKTREQLDKDERFYKEMKEKFFGLHFVKDNGLEVKMIQSVLQVFDEGTLLRHCMFSNRYDRKPDTILLSATIDNVVIETVEVDIINFKIIQARGRFNKPSSYNKEIVELVNNNMYQIQNLEKQKKAA